MEHLVILAGAGISAEPPSNLPSWWEYNKKLISQIKLEALELCPEATDILECIDVEKNLPIQCISQLIVSYGAGESYFPLLELLDGTVPNANHFALVKLAQLNRLKAIVTTNFDTLIETAFRSEYVPLYIPVRKQDYYESAQVTCCKLFKIHGSVYNTASLIDTVSQKAIGLSPEKRLILENLLLDSDIFVIGFSGSDLDFDLDYIPLKRAIESGSNLTWVIRPNSTPNPNVLELQRLYPKNVCIREMELHELFEFLGVYDKDGQRTFSDTTVTENENKLTQRIKDLFSSDHIGAHGCVGYCLTLLEMIGANEAEKRFAEIYEKKLDWSALNVFSVPGIKALARRKMLNRDWNGAIHDYNVVIQCYKHLNTLNHEFQKTADKAVSPERSKRLEREYAQNLSSAYINLGNVYYSMAVVDHEDTLSDAKKCFGLAQSQMKNEPDIPYHSMISFGLARVEYQIDKNYDRYINELHISREYAKKEGQLDTLAEILLEECRIHMQIGEYYLAHNSLEFSRNVLKNVGLIALKQMWEKLDCEYRLRTGEKAYPMTEDVLQTLMSRVNEYERKAIIWFEANQKTEHLPTLFNKLGVKYITSGSWQRLWDVAQCCNAVACTDPQKADALYLLGCAAAELAKYQKAEECFWQIVNMGKGVNDIKLGWTHSELARLFIKKGDIAKAMHHFDECIQMLQQSGDLEHLEQAAASIIADLFNNNYADQADRAVAQLKAATADSSTVNLQNFINYLHCIYDCHIDEDIQSNPPHEIATQALRLYDMGDTKKAWEWMQLAKKKYEEEGNADGAGRCENNMGVWCLTEENYEKAVVHLKAAMYIKCSLGDVGGVINQLSMLLEIYTLLLKEFNEAAKLVHYAEQNMPLFADKAERYKLYSSLALYKIQTGDFASALNYAKEAEKGMPYLSKAYFDSEENMRLMISHLENAFVCRTASDEQTEFDAQIREASRLGKICKLDDCLALLEQLKGTFGEDRMKDGILKGTCANAFLKAEKYIEAIYCYRLAIAAFKDVTGDNQETATNHILTAQNGICIAMGHLRQSEEAITLIRQELEQTEMPHSGRFSLTVNLCNRLISLHADTLQRNDSIFTEVSNALDSLVHSEFLSHEERGVIYCAYGALHMAIRDNALAKHYYQQAKEELSIVNSIHLNKALQAINMLEELT